MLAMRLAGWIALLVMAPCAARAQTKEQCVTAFDNGQELREALKLRAAKERLLVCARDACPAPLRKDCAELLAQVIHDMPSVALGARDPEGHDVKDFTAVIDGERLSIDASGRALPIDPGPHDVRFEHARYGSVVEHVVVRVGERNRVILATFRAPPGRPPAPTPAAKPPPPPDPSQSVAEVPTAVYVLGAVGALGLGVFTFLAITGKSEKDKLVASCAPACSDAEVSRVRTRYIAADISLGIAMVALGAATYLLLSASSPTTSALLRAPSGIAF
jgi:hypothetical protein